MPKKGVDWSLFTKDFPTGNLSQGSDSNLEKAKENVESKVGDQAPFPAFDFHHRVCNPRLEKKMTESRTGPPRKLVIKDHNLDPEARVPVDGDSVWHMSEFREFCLACLGFDPWDESQCPKVTGMNIIMKVNEPVRYQFTRLKEAADGFWQHTDPIKIATVEKDVPNRIEQAPVSSKQEGYKYEPLL